MKRRRQVKEGLLSLETIETWIVYVCHSEGEWAETTYLSAVEQGMVVVARHISLSVSRTASLLGFSRSTVSCVYQKWSNLPKDIQSI